MRIRWLAPQRGATALVLGQNLTLGLLHFCGTISWRNRGCNGVWWSAKTLENKQHRKTSTEVHRPRPKPTKPKLRSRQSQSQSGIVEECRHGLGLTLCWPHLLSRMPRRRNLVSQPRVHNPMRSQPAPATHCHPAIPRLTVSPNKGRAGSWEVYVVGHLRQTVLKYLFWEGCPVPQEYPDGACPKMYL